MHRLQAPRAVDVGDSGDLRPPVSANGIHLHHERHVAVELEPGDDVHGQVGAADDVAHAVVASLHEGPRDLAIGGPDVLTRAQVLQAAFDALGKRMRAVHVPPWVFRMQAAMLRPLQPRLSELFEFVAAVSTHDGIAPVYGQKRLVDWFAAPR